MDELCYHCGDKIIVKKIVKDEHQFCCNGCLSVYTLLNEHQLTSFYELEKNAGKKPKKIEIYKYLFLDQQEIRKKFVDFEDENLIKISLYLPDIHCSSCIYLLENIQKIKPEISQSIVNFTKKEASFTFNPNKIKLSELAQLLEKIGYEPNFGNRKNTEKKINKTFLYKLGIAGFSFGSTMLWSFPEYLGISEDNIYFRNLTSYLSLGVSIPVLFYSASDYFISAYKALKYRSINLDVPIAIGILALYLQSLWSILNNEGPGYIDSFSGFIFFLLIGKWFQNLSYRSLSFERDYTSYFPVAITKIQEEREEIIEIEKLSEKDRILIRNEEIIPCDSILLSESAQIDFSFVTGESNLVKKEKGDFIYAGGKLLGKKIELEVKNKSNRSHLTSLWNELSDNKNSNTKSYQDKVSIYFLITVISISIISGIAWYFIDPSKITHVVVSVLIVTCPCALALSSPFTLGNIMRLLGRKGLYLKNTQVIERINKTTDIVFDKTGTLTSNKQKLEFLSNSTNFESYFSHIYYAVSSSTHPLSIAIKNYLYENYSIISLEPISFKETIGFGIEAVFKDEKNVLCSFKIGSPKFIGIEFNNSDEVNTFISMNDTYLGRVVFSSDFRIGLDKMIPRLKTYQLHVLTGDHKKDENQIKELFPSNSTILFEQKPLDKLNYIENLEKQGKRVLMIGDGLNDSGALKVANVGIAVSEDSFRFTPSSDAIIDSKSIIILDRLLKISKSSKSVLLICLIFSLFYNVIGLSFAISGNLSPLIAAILMPISSITVVFISTYLVLWKGNNSTII